MKEDEQNILLEMIDQLTERVPDEYSEQESHLVADLYRVYQPYAQENEASLQRIWSRFAQEQGSEEYPLFVRRLQAHAASQDEADTGAFRQIPQAVPHYARRSFRRRLGIIVNVAVLLLFILGWALFTYAIPNGTSQTALASGGSLTLNGSRDLKQDIVFLVKSSAGRQYLAANSFSTYTELGWTNDAVTCISLPSGKQTISEGSPVRLVTQQFKVISAPGETNPYIFAAGQIASVDQPATVLLNKDAGSQIAVLFNSSRSLSAGDQYTVTSYISSADVQMLQSVPFPFDVMQRQGAYLQLPKIIDPRVEALTLQLTAHAHNMYDEVVALENYFRTSFTYSTDVSPPSGKEAVAWLLFQSDHRAFSSYFATAMAVMVRELGIPARIVSGYAPGPESQDVTELQNWEVRASDAHVWTQVYFAPYGWINFEPSPGFKL